jgi:hypothetical protein
MDDGYQPKLTVICILNAAMHSRRVSQVNLLACEPVRRVALLRARILRI